MVEEGKFTLKDTLYLPEELSTILDSISELIVVSDENYRILYMNEAARRKYGDGVGMKCYKVYSGLDEPCYSQGMPCSHLYILNKGERRYTYTAKDPQGRWLEVHAAPIKFEGERAVVEVVRDITDRKRLEEELEASGKEFELIFNSLEDDVTYLDTDFNILKLNEAAIKTFHLKGKKFSNMKCYRVFEGPDASAPCHGCAVKKSLKTKKIARSTRKRRDGRIVELTSVPILNEKGEIRNIVEIAHDITELKRAEEKIREYSHSLEKMVEERTRDLRQANDEIRILNEKLTERLIEKTNQISKISKLRDELRKTPDLSTGLEKILESVLNLLNLDLGAVMIINQEENSIKPLVYKGRRRDVRLDDSYRLDEDYVELKDLMEKEPVYTTVNEKPSILGSPQIYRAPLYSGKNLKGVLALGCGEKQSLDKSDLALLGLYGELASTLFEQQRLRVKPLLEEETIGERHFKLEYGCAYLFRGEVEEAYRVFADQVLSGLPGLCITRTFPPKIKRQYGLKRTAMVWLSEEKTDEASTVFSLQDLSILIGQFLESAEKGVVLLDGFEYLIVNHGFEPFIRFLQLLRSRIEQHGGILLSPLLEESLETRQAKLIEREMKEFRTE